MGLSISSNLVSLIGGEIGVSSLINKGSEFWVILTYLISDKTGENVVKQVLTEEIDIPVNLKILYAEDNLINQKVTVMMLQKLGVNCDIAQNGVEAFEMHKNNNYDIILMDMQMPELDGIECTKIIRKYEAENNEINPVYILAVTANTFTSDMNICFEAGMNDFISKPFKDTDIKDKIRKALNVI